MLVDRTVEHWTVFGVIDFAIHGSVQAGAVFTLFDSDHFVMVIHHPVKIALFYRNGTIYFSRINYKIDILLKQVIQHCPSNRTGCLQSIGAHSIGLQEILPLCNIQTQSVI